ncbi:MAG: winged helix-turn-helix domain-containing protein [Saprospiraceae bacterium]|nr:winged helix-turn-helix domain-containing protein [Lewinella sp.]
MKTKVAVWLAGFTAILLLLILTSVSKSPDSDTKAALQEEQENVALRAIADALLKQNDDWTSPVPPIRREGDRSYFIPLKSGVNYSILRVTIDNILEEHHIRPDYRVSLLDCSTGLVALGFQAQAEERSDGFACQDREQMGLCYNLRLTFLDKQEGRSFALQPQINSWPPVKWVLLGLTCFLPFIWLTWNKKEKDTIETEEQGDGWQQHSQHTAFHHANQLLKIDDKQLTLTYREAKLLDYFFQYPNQVLERDRILQAVWEDEGVIVGRSLDVFVSRLRKKLKADPDLQLVNVHGVGYKLEVRPPDVAH